MTTAYGIEIGDEAIVLVELRAAGKRLEVTQAVTMGLPDDRSPEGLAEALAPYLPARRARVALAVPASGCIVKTASLPPAKPADLAQVVEFEAASQFPLALQDLTWGYALAPDAGRVHATLVGARRSLVDGQLALVEGLGLHVTAVSMAPLAAASTIALPDGLAVLVIAGREWSDLCLYANGNLQRVRSAMAGPPNGPEWVERLAREMQSWTSDADIGQVLLIGDLQRETVQALHAALALPVQLQDPWAGFHYRSTEPGQQGHAPGHFATALGLAKIALQPKTAINLLPAQVRAGRARLRKTGLLAAGLGLIVVLLAMLALGNARALTQRRAQLRALEPVPAQQAAKGPQGNLTAAEQAIDALNAPDSTPLEFLRVLSESAPEGMVLTDFTFNRGRSLVLKGRVPTHDLLATTLQALAKSSLLERAMLDYANQLEDGRGYAFQITCMLPPSTDPTLTQARGTSNARPRTAGTP